MNQADPISLTSADETGSAAFSTNTNMLHNLHGRNFGARSIRLHLDHRHLRRQLTARTSSLAQNSRRLVRCCSVPR
jgi:hypothetical protein